MRGDAVRREARVHVPAVARREEQEVRRGAPHHREVPGALQAALLHPPRKVSACYLPYRLYARVLGVDWCL